MYREPKFCESDERSRKENSYTLVFLKQLETWFDNTTSLYHQNAAKQKVFPRYFHSASQWIIRSKLSTKYQQSLMMKIKEAIKKNLPVIL